MKKFILSIFCSLVLLASANAQFDVENLFGGVNIGYAKPMGGFSDYAKGGFAYNAEAGYKLKENLGVGVMYQGVITAAIDSDSLSGLIGLNLYGLESYLAKGWYTFTDGKVKPYAALGLGLAKVAEPDITINSQTIEGAKRFGFGANVELGVTFSGFNVSYSFNMGGRSPKEGVFNGGDDLSVMYHYFGIGYLYNL